jgi:hypothetical protein
MNISTLKKILLRLFNDYIKKHLFKIIIALFLSFGVAAGTAAIAWLLDPAIKKIFIEQSKSMLLLIPAAIVLAKKRDRPLIVNASIIAAGISNSIDLLCSIKIFLIAGSNSHAIAAVPAATPKDKKSAIIILNKCFFM